MRSFKVYFVLITVLPIGCATTGPPATGFLSDYVRLEPHPAVAGARVYWNPDVDRSKYASIELDPIEVHFAREQDFKRTDPERVSDFKRLVKNALEEAFAEHFRLSKSQGQSVARLRVQVSNIRLVSEMPRTRSYVHLSKYHMGSVNVEAELTDSSTGEFIAAWVGPRRSMGQTERLRRPEDWEGVRSDMDVALRTLVDKVMGRLRETRPNS